MQSFGLFLVLGLLLGIAAIINRLAGKPVANGAKHFLFVAAAALVVSLLFAYEKGPYAFGSSIGSFLFPVALALYLNKRFKNRVATSVQKGAAVAESGDAAS
jgi:putative copper export protein